MKRVRRVRRGSAARIVAAALVLTVAAAWLVLSSAGGRPAARPAVVRTTAPRAPIAHPGPVVASSVARPKAKRRHPPRRARRVRLALVSAAITDPVRFMDVGGQRVPRAFRTIIRYPLGLPGPFPLIVFGHGFAVSPAPYSALLDAWTKAGYVVAAPVFPLENGAAPGGPDERDLVNQPADMSLVISALQSPQNPALARVARLVDFTRIAVTGQSDGGDTALADAYGPGRDTRISVAMILSGAEDPFAAPFAMPAHGPPLLAIQGTADTINPPPLTYAFYDQAAAPKYLLKLLGAGHQPPYTAPGPQLTAVEHMTLAFLNHYLKHHSAAFPRYLTAGSAGPGSQLTFAR